MHTYTKRNRANFAFLGRPSASVGLLLLSALCAQAELFNLTSYVDSQGHRIDGPTQFATGADGNGTAATIPWSQYLGADLNYHDGAVINGALVIPSLSGSGSGTYRRLYALDSGGQTTAALNGYNRELPNKAVTEFDSNIPTGFDPVILCSQLIYNSGYFQFSLDINEVASAKKYSEFLSIDDLQIYVGSATEPNPLPSALNASGTLDGLGTLIWDLQAGQTAGQKNHILAKGSGSGEDEIAFLIPASLFANFQPGDKVYFYSKVGALGFANETGQIYTGFQENGGGFEEWGTLTPGSTPGIPAPPFSPVPEPSAALSVLCLMLAGLSRRSRARVA